MYKSVPGLFTASSGVFSGVLPLLCAVLFFIEMHSIQIDAGFIHGFSGVFTEALPFVFFAILFFQPYFFSRLQFSFITEMHSIQIGAGFVHGFSGVFSEAVW